MKYVACFAVLALFNATGVFAACGSGDCGVGALGTGGVKSDGKAKGFHEERPSTRYSGETYTNVGNPDAGRLSVSNTGTLQGTYRDGVSRGHTTGEFGNDSGRY